MFSFKKLISFSKSALLFLTISKSCWLSQPAVEMLKTSSWSSNCFQQNGEVSRFIACAYVFCFCKDWKWGNLDMVLKREKNRERGSTVLQHSNFQLQRCEARSLVTLPLNTVFVSVAVFGCSSASPPYWLVWTSMSMLKHTLQFKLQ